MPNVLTWWTGNRNPSISETITIDDVPFDLSISGAQRFKMRAIGSGTLKVDQPATIVNPPGIDGQLRYDWGATDLDTADNYLVWWEITVGANVQSMGEAVIQVLAHAPVSRDYVELEDLKKTLSLDGLSFADLDIKDAITAASRKVDWHTDRRFYPDADAAQVRVFSPSSPDRIYIDDLVTLTSLKTDPAGDGTYEETWVAATDYVLEPINAAADGLPWTSISVRSNGSFYFPTRYAESVQITGKFGWSEVPADVRVATKLIAHRYLKRLREAATGVVGFGMDGAVVRMMSVDPDVEDLLAPYSRRVFVA